MTPQEKAQRLYRALGDVYRVMMAETGQRQQQLLDAANKIYEVAVQITAEIK